MSPAVPASLAAAAVVALAAVVVRPVALAGGARLRDVVADGGAGRTLPDAPLWFSDAVDRAALPGAAGTWFRAAVALPVAAALVGGFLGGPILAVLVGSGVGSAVAIALRANGDRRDQLLGRAVPDSLDAIARSSRAGSSVVQALSALDGPDASAADRVLASVAHRVERGESLDHALGVVAERHQVPAVRLAITALIVGTETGGAPARAVEGVAATLRDRAALEREAEAHSSQARASALVLVLAPILFGFFAVSTDPRVADFLFRSWAGWVCLAAGLGLDAAGWWWMRSITRSAR